MEITASLETNAGKTAIVETMENASMLRRLLLRSSSAIANLDGLDLDV